MGVDNVVTPLKRCKVKTVCAEQTIFEFIEREARRRETVFRSRESTRVGRYNVSQRLNSLSLFISAMNLESRNDSAISLIQSIRRREIHTLSLCYVRSQTRIYRTYERCWMSVLIVSKFAANCPNKIRTRQSITRWLDRCPIFRLRDVQTLESPSTSKKIVKNNARPDARWHFLSSGSLPKLASNLLN